MSGLRAIKVFILLFLLCQAGLDCLLRSPPDPLLDPNQMHGGKPVAGEFENRINAILAKKEFDKGVRCCDSKDWVTAIELFDKAIELDPKFWEAYYNRGIVFRRQGETQKGIADYSKAIELDSTNAEPYIGRGNAYRKEGEYEKAIADYSAVIDRGLGSDAPRPLTYFIRHFAGPQAKAYFGRGISYQDLREYEKAIVDFTKVIELDEKEPAGYHYRAIAYADLGEHEKAIADYSTVIELDPDDPLAYHNRALAYGSLGEHEEAIADYTKVIQRELGSAKAWANRGFAYVRLGRHDKAIADFNKAIKLDQLYALAFFGRSIVHRENGDIEESNADKARAKILGFDL